MASTPSVPQTPRCEKIQIANADGTTQKTVITGATNGTKVTGIIATSIDTAAHDIQTSIVKGGVTYLLGTKSVPANSGNVTGTPAINLMDPAVMVGLPIDADGQPYLFLETGDTLVVNALVTVTAAKTISLISVAADF